MKRSLHYTGMSLKRDLVDLNLGIRLSVTDLLLLVFLGLVGHNVDLLSLAVLHYVGRYGCTFHYGRTSLEACISESYMKERCFSCLQ